MVGDVHFKDEDSQIIISVILRAILQESEAKLDMKIFNPPSFFVWR